MEDVKRPRFVRKRRLISYSGRGDVYSWLRVHHDELRELRVGQVRPWSEAIADMKDDLGLPADSTSLALNNVCNIWRRVRRDVAADPAPATPKSKSPSRISPDWRPQVVQAPLPVQAPPPVRPPLPVSPSTASSAPAAQRAAVSAEVQAKIDRVLEQLGDEDRKKFRFGG